MAETRLEELERTCFVIMPFGVKESMGEQVDFNVLYHDVFVPGISGAETPEKVALDPRRTDQDAFSGSINQEMFEYIVYSRLAFADISGLNPNVLYEIGVRHGVQDAGTVLFRQAGHPIPFDITTIKVFEYDRERPDDARALISRVISETMAHNRLDSPVRLALRAQWGLDPEDAGGKEAAAPARGAAATVDPSAGEAAEQLFLRGAEEALRLGDVELARENYWAASKLRPADPLVRMRLGLTFKQLGRLHDALDEFTTVTRLSPEYGEAWKEKGVIEGRIARKLPEADRPSWFHDGQASLERATQLIPNDFDAWASLAGVFKNVKGDRTAAAEHYAHAAEISEGHPYPLLNAIRLEAERTGHLDITAHTGLLEHAEALRRGQMLATPPTDAPWSYFDVAEICAYRGDEAGFLEALRGGLERATAEDEPETFRRSLQDLADLGLEIAGLDEAIRLIDAKIASMK